MLRNRLGGLALALTLVAAPATTEATVVKALSLREKARIAPVVVHGVVQRVEVSWRDPGTFIQTIVTLKVTEALKGGHEPGDVLRIYRGGGRIGDVHQTAPGLSQYEVGEEVVLFLEPLGAEYVGIGIGIAKYAVQSTRGEKIVTHAPNVSGATFRDGQPPVIEPIEPMSPTPLPAFLKTLRSYVREIPAHRPAASPRKGAVLKAPLPLPERAPRETAR